MNKSDEGYVYLIGTRIFGWYKIGKSRTPEIRVKDLGILLPFKLEIIGIWKAKNHHLMEKSLHEIYAKNRINGEWFEFDKKLVDALFDFIPIESRVYPSENLANSFFENFSNIKEDLKNSKRIRGVKIQKLRGNFTDEERNERRLASIEQQKKKKELKLMTNK